MKKLLLAFILLSLCGCVTTATYLNKIQLMEPKDKFAWQSCMVEYCEQSESLISKKLALAGLQILADYYNIPIKFGRGICETYYTKRELQTGYVYALKSAKQVCDERRDHHEELREIEENKEENDDEDSSDNAPSTD